MNNIRTIRIKDKGVERILPSDKDEILNAMLSNTEDEWFNFDKSCVPDSKLNKIQFESVINQFIKLGLIEKRGYSSTIKLNVEASDFANRGGFQMQEEFVFGQLKALALQIDILEDEVKKLENKPNQLINTINKIGEISKNINAIYSTTGIVNKIIESL